MDYELIRSARKTLAIEVRGNKVIVRSPYRTPMNKINSFVKEHDAWIQKWLAKNAAKQKAAKAIDYLTSVEIMSLAKEACTYIPKRVAAFAGQIGVSYGRITIRCQKTKWGSCSAKGNLNFNCLLMLTPPEIIDSVVVHELCHRKEMNHSSRFYDEIYKVFPEYDKCRKWLKANGSAIMARVKR